MRGKSDLEAFNDLAELNRIFGKRRVRRVTGLAQCNTFGHIDGKEIMEMTNSVSESRISLAWTLFAVANRFPKVHVDELLKLRFRVREEYNELLSHQMVKAVWDRASPAKRVVRELQRIMVGPMLRRHWLFAAATGLAEFVAAAHNASQGLREEGDRLIAAIPRTRNNQPRGPNTKIALPVDDWQFVSELGVVGSPVLSRPRTDRRNPTKRKRSLRDSALISHSV